MPWHPSLSPKRVATAARSRIAFLKRFAEIAPDVMVRPRGRQADGKPEVQDWEPTAANPPLLAAVAAWTEAAELAFLSNQTPEGLALVDQALDRLLAVPSGGWPTLRVALLGAITKRVRTVLTPEGIEVATNEMRATRPWVAEAGIADQTAGAVLAAVLAHGSAREGLAWLGAAEDNGDEELTVGVVAIRNSSEFDVLPLFGVFPSDRGRARGDAVLDDVTLGWVAVVARLQRYAARVRLLTADRVGWSALRFRAPLLDWPLVATFLGIRRLEQVGVNEGSGRALLNELVDRRCGGPGPVRDLAAYLRDLAGEIEEHRGPEQGTFGWSGGGGPPLGQAERAYQRAFGSRSQSR
jgi:hypothetical protein